MTRLALNPIQTSAAYPHRTVLICRDTGRRVAVPYADCVEVAGCHVGLIVNRKSYRTMLPSAQGGGQLDNDRNGTGGGRAGVPPG